MSRLRLLIPLVLVLAPLPVSAGTERPPARIGACALTEIKSVGTRLMDGDQPVADSGSAVTFANGGYQVSYDNVPAIDRSRSGDHVRMCLIALPTHCPPGDDRGRLYKTTNLRTGQSWTLRDSEHMCGGA